MKENLVYEGNKKALIATIMLIVIIFSASYAFFTSYNTANVSYNLTVGNELNITYALNAGSNITLNVNPVEMGVGGVESLSSSEITSDSVSLLNASEYPRLKCTYDIWYEPSSAFVNSSTNLQKETELEIIGTDKSGTNGTFHFDLDGITSATKMTSAKIITNSPTTSAVQNWQFTMTHYNINANQIEHMGKSYGGRIYFKGTGCEESTELAVPEFYICDKKYAGTEACKDNPEEIYAYECDGAEPVFGYYYTGDGDLSFECSGDSCTRGYGVRVSFDTENSLLSAGGACVSAIYPEEELITISIIAAETDAYILKKFDFVGYHYIEDLM